jgi:TIR domain/Pentapeptide repeats (9 copies)
MSLCNVKGYTLLTPTAVYRERQEFYGRLFKDSVCFDNVVFEGDVDFSGATFEKGVSFNGTIFKKSASFRMCKVFDRIWFWNARFMGPANFHSLLVVKDPNAPASHIYPGEANFSWTRFHDEAIFKWARFAGKTFFWRTLFHQRVDFEGAVFGEDGALFNGTRSEVQIPYHVLDEGNLALFTQERILRPDVESPTIKFAGRTEIHSLYLFGENIKSFEQFLAKAKELRSNSLSQQEVETLERIWHEGARPMFQRPDLVCFDNIEFARPAAIELLNVNLPMETRFKLYKHKEIKANYTQQEDETADDSYWSCFISYSSKDADFVKYLKERLRGELISAWLDFDNIVHSGQLTEQIKIAVSKHDKLLIVLSKSSLESDWVKKEIKEALKKDVKALFPIRITSVDEIKKHDFIWDTFKDVPILDFEFDPEHEVVNASFEDSFGKLVKSLKKPNGPPQNAAHL